MYVEGLVTVIFVCLLAFFLQKWKVYFISIWWRDRQQASRNTIVNFGKCVSCLV